MSRDDGAARDAQRAADCLEIDPGRSNIICAIGGKGSGKSEALRTLFEAWPYNRVSIDVTGDARPADPDTLIVTAPFPSQLPEPQEGQHRVTMWARCDPRRPTYVEDQDDALGLALYPRHTNCLAWVDEYSQMATAAKSGPNLRLALQSSRHYYATLLFATQRPRSIPVLTLQQADKVFIFRVANFDDREYIAKNIGYPVREFERRYFETQERPEHSFLVWDLRQGLLLSCPPLPLQQTHGPRA